MPLEVEDNVVDVVLDAGVEMEEGRVVTLCDVVELFILDEVEDWELFGLDELGGLVKLEDELKDADVVDPRELGDDDEEEDEDFEVVEEIKDEEIDEVRELLVLDIEKEEVEEANCDEVVEPDS